MHKLAVFALTLAVALPAAAADNSADAEARAKAVAPFLDDQTILVMRADLTRIDPDALLTKLGETVPVPPKELAEAKQLSRQWVAEFTKAGGKELYLIFSLADLSAERPMFAVVPLPEGAKARALQGLLASGSPTGDTSGHGMFPSTAMISKAVFGGAETTAKRLEVLKPAARPELAKAFAAAGDTAGQVLVLPTADSRRVIEEMLPMLPMEIGGGPSKALTRGFLWAAVGADPPPKMTLRAVIQSQDAGTAKAFSGVLTKIIKALGQQKEVRNTFPKFESIAARLTPAPAGDQLTLNLDDTNQAITKVLADLKPTVERARQSAERMQCMNNLKQLGLALHNYHDTHNAFPAVANFDKQGKPLLSWRVHLLPYLEGQELYKEFRLNEPWDSEHNKKLIPRMPASFRCPSSKAAALGKTGYLAVVGQETIFTGGPKGVRIAEITDGTSNTILLVDASDDRAVIWTKPDDLKFDPQRLLVDLIGHHEGGFHATFADGSVRFLQATIDPRNLQAVFTRNGGEVIDLP
jgi:hypothetical protein